MVKLYSTNYCPFCDQAKRLLQMEKIAFEEIYLDDKEELRSQLSQENGGWRTVPMIFIGNEFIGGFQELAALKRQGVLADKLAQQNS